MKPTAAIDIIRQKVRAVLKLAAGDPLTEAQVHEGVTSLLGKDQGLQAVRDAIEWNHAAAFIRKEWIDEAEKTGLFITKAGIAKENLK